MQIQINARHRKSLRKTINEIFELNSRHRDQSGGLQLRYGTDPTDPTPFILMPQPQHVSRALGQ
jgi:hypothetical protein